MCFPLFPGGSRSSPTYNGSSHGSWGSYWSGGSHSSGTPGVPAGYKMAQDPLTGQLFLVPGMFHFIVSRRSGSARGVSLDCREEEDHHSGWQGLL